MKLPLLSSLIKLITNGDRDKRPWGLEHKGNFYRGKVIGGCCIIVRTCYATRFGMLCLLIATCSWRKIIRKEDSKRLVSSIDGTKGRGQCSSRLESP
jgi:hypothetical protein